MFNQFSFKNLGQNKAAGLATEMRYTAAKSKNVLLSRFLVVLSYMILFLYLSAAK